jgi:SAM-dependent methyltransferase
MSLVELPRVIAEAPGQPDALPIVGEMQALTRSIAFDGAWTPERKEQIASFFDAMAEGWRDRDAPERHDPVHDALARGGPYPDGWCVEVGSGTGNVTADFQRAFGDVVSLDISLEMLRLAPGTGPQIQSDASQLPLRSASAAVLALVNMFVFPAEIARVLTPDGVLLHVSTGADRTPIYLAPADVMQALPGEWQGITAPAGWGTWLTARRGASRGSST